MGEISMNTRPSMQGAFAGVIQKVPTVRVTTNPVSTVSGKPCTFWGGMEVIANGCAAGSVSPTPVEGCLTQALQSSATHTAGCINVEVKTDNANNSTTNLKP